METEEITKLVDGIYKNILDKFNPGARQLINAGKAYLKALHGAAAASRLYVEAITKLARQAQQGTWGGSQDIGTALSQIVQVYKEIQNQQMNILKAFYVDLLVPLETNLEKDTKVVQSEQKRFLQQHKQRSETYSKAVASMKKQRKKNKGATKTGLAMDKELKHMQVLEEEKTKLDSFCEQSLKTAMTQERRRYGFVLERQCSLAKHYLAYHAQGGTLLQRYMDEWQEIAGTREYLPEQVDAVFASRLRQVSFWPDDEQVYASPRSPLLLMSPDDSESADRLSVSSQLRKTKSMDASCLDVRSINDMTAPGPSTPKPLSRARSEFNLAASSHSLAHEPPDTPVRPKSMAIPERSAPWDQQLARALYAYLSSGENQLSFLEGDVIALMGERNKGWQFGENLRTQCSGWFPLAYTEMILDDSIISSPTHPGLDSSSSSCAATPSANATLLSGKAATPSSTAPSSAPTPETRPSPGNGPSAMGSNVGNSTAGRPGHLENARQFRQRTVISSNGVPPPSLPAPPKPHMVPMASTLPPRRLHGSGTAIPPAPPIVTKGRPVSATHSGPPATGSLHSSNDSGFSNDPPPAPEVDYSDDESRQFKSPRLEKRNQQLTKKNLMSSVRGWLLYKSALDLWDDVNSQQPSHQPHQQKTQSSGKQHRLRHAASANHLLTNQPLSLPPTSLDDSTSVASVKRSKSLWRFRRSQRDEDMILEGMSLWQHRSLVDIPKETEPKRPTIPPPPPPPSAPAPPPPPTIPRSDPIPSATVTITKQPKLHQIYNIDDDGLAEPELDDDVESCIVVDDHTADVTPIPRPKCHTLTPKRERRAITVLAATLQHSHFETKRSHSPNFNEGICGPWYDLWGVDASVVN